MVFCFGDTLTCCSWAGDRVDSWWPGSTPPVPLSHRLPPLARTCCVLPYNPAAPEEGAPQAALSRLSKEFLF